MGYRAVESLCISTAIVIIATVIFSNQRVSGFFIWQKAMSTGTGLSWQKVTLLSRLEIRKRGLHIKAWIYLCPITTIYHAFFHGPATVFKYVWRSADPCTMPAFEFALGGLESVSWHLLCVSCSLHTLVWNTSHGDWARLLSAPSTVINYGQAPYPHR